MKTQHLQCLQDYSIKSEEWKEEISYMDKGEKKNRNLKYEVLRIIAAVFILFNHIDVAFSDQAVGGVGTWNRYMIRFFHLGGKFGVNVFVILGCYFLVGSKWKASRILRLILEVVFYGLILNLADMFIFGKHLSPGDFARGLSYWFPVCYIVMLLMMPVLNRIIETKLAPVIAVAGVVASGGLITWGWVAPNRLFQIVTLEHIVGSLWFCYLFVLVGWLKKKGFFEHPLYGKIGIVAFPAFYLLMYVLTLVTNRPYFRDMYSMVCLLAAMSLFLAVHHSRERKRSRLSERLITQVAPATFGTYLLQCNNNTAGIWREVFAYDTFAESGWLLPVCVGSVLALLALATLLSLIYREILAKRIGL